MLTIKQAIERIKEQFQDLFGSDIEDIRLEEIGQSSDNNYNLTISFLVSNKSIQFSLASMLGGGGMNNLYSRQYKTVIINKEDGTIITIRIHKDA